MSKIHITNFEGVYEPAEDSWLMSRHIPKFKGSVLEIGCGSGIISIHLAQRGNQVTAIDINPKAVEATKFNTKNNNQLQCSQCMYGIRSKIITYIENYDLSQRGLKTLVQRS